MWSWSGGDGDGYVIECDNEYCGCSYGNNMSLDADTIAKLWNTRVKENKE
jgi:outer membrane protein assembly factor BamB